MGETRNVFIRDVNSTLYRLAKVRAAQLGIPLKDFIQDAIKEKLTNEPEPREEEKE